MGFLNYLRLQFWIVCLLIDLGILIGWTILAYNRPMIGMILAIPALIIAVVPDVIAYVAIHLRFDTTWAVNSGSGREMLRRRKWCKVTARCRPQAVLVPVVRRTHDNA